MKVRSFDKQMNGSTSICNNLLQTSPNLIFQILNRKRKPYTDFWKQIISISFDRTTTNKSKPNSQKKHIFLQIFTRKQTYTKPTIIKANVRRNQEKFTMILGGNNGNKQKKPQSNYPFKTINSLHHLRNFHPVIKALLRLNGTPYKEVEK